MLKIIEVDGNEFNFEILDCDNDKVIEIIKSFPDGLNDKGIGLTPQLWWGNLDNPNIVILGLNPSCRDTDFDYNRDECEFKEILRNNLSYDNRNEELKLNSLFQSDVSKDIPVIKTWRDEYKLSCLKEKLKDVAIYNLFGYYQTNLVKIDTKLSHIKGDIKKDITEKIINAGKVVFLWKGKKDIWMNFLCNDVDKKTKRELEEKFSNALYANEQCTRKPDFSSIINQLNS